MNFTVRNADYSDIHQLCFMLGELFSIEDDFKPDPEKQARALEMIISGERAGVILVAEAGPKIIGMINLQRVISTAAGGYSILLEDLYVVPGYRNAGTGKLLVDHAVQWGREHGALRIQLAADIRNSPAGKFYSRMGFKKSNMIFYYRYL